MADKDFPFPGLKVTEADLADLPPSALRTIILQLAEYADRRERRIKELEAKLNRNSSNSNKPPSMDSPYKEKDPKPKKRKQGGRKGRKGHRQQLMVPTETVSVHPGPCSCGCENFKDLQPYYTHQQVELSEIIMTVMHFILYKGKCTACGKIGKGYIPAEHTAGYGPRLSALVAELGGIDGNSRETSSLSAPRYWG